MGVVRLSNAGIRDFQKVDNFLAGNTAFSPDDEDFLEEVVLTSDASSVSFTGLGSYSTYKHLQIRATTRTNRASTGGIINTTFNSDTSASYSSHELYGTGSLVSSDEHVSDTNIRVAFRGAGNPSVANSFGAGVLDILDFSSTSKNTTIRSLTGATDGNIISLASGSYLKTDAITSITLSPEDATLLISGSRFSLYGAK